jgi:hypothetical protein
MATRAECQRALARHQDDLSQRRNVVGLGIVSCNRVLRLTRADALAVAVYVSRKIPPDQLSQEDVVPRVVLARCGGREIEVPVEVIEQGTIALDAIGKER